MVKFNRKAKILTLSPVNIYCMNYDTNIENSRDCFYKNYPYITY